MNNGFPCLHCGGALRPTGKVVDMILGVVDTEQGTDVYGGHNVIPLQIHQCTECFFEMRIPEKSELYKHTMRAELAESARTANKEA